MTRAWITSRTEGDPQGIWPDTQWIVRTEANVPFAATWPLAKLRCRLYGLFCYGRLLPVVPAGGIGADRTK